MVAQANNKDVVLRFIGKHDIGPAATAVKRELDGVIAHVQKVNKLTSQVVADRLVAARQFKSEIEAINRFAQQQGPARLNTAQVAARAVAKRDKWMEPFLNPDEGARGWVRYGSAAEGAFIQAERGAKRFATTAKKALGGLGMAWAFGGDLVTGQLAGSRSPVMAGLGAGADIGGAAAMGAMFGGGPGAMVMGGIETIRQVAGAREKAAKAEQAAANAQVEVIKGIHSLANARIFKIQEFADAILPDPKRHPVRNLAGGSFQLHGQADKMNEAMKVLFAKPASLQSIAEIEALAKERDAARAEAHRLQRGFLAEQLLSHFTMPWLRGVGHGFETFPQRLGRGIGNTLGPAAQRTAFEFQQLFSPRPTEVNPAFGGSPIANALGAWIGQGFGRLLGPNQREREIFAGAPAGALRQRLRDLDQERRLGQITPGAHAEARRQRYFEAIGSLPSNEGAPGLQATEGRFLTQGRRSKEADELSALRREAKQHAQTQERQLGDLLRALQGEGVGQL